MAPSKTDIKNILISPLYNAVKLGDLASVIDLLGKNASVLVTDADGNSPLHLAFINKEEIMTIMLLQDIHKKSEYSNLKNKHNLSHFHIACTRPISKIVQGSLDAGANAEVAVSTKSDSWAGYTAVHFAIAFKSLEALQVLLKSDVNMQIKNTAEQTPLSLANQFVEDWLIMIDLLKNRTEGPHLSNFHMACLAGKRETVEKFIDHGMTVDSIVGKTQIQSLSTPLHFAVMSRDLEKVRLLLENGAKVDSQNSDKMTPLHLAFYNEKLQHDMENTLEMVDLLYTSISDKTEDYVDIHGLSYFHIAITRNDIPTLKDYLDSGDVDVNKPLSQAAPRFSKYTPLQLAVRYQNVETVELLIERGADVNATDENKAEMPLYMAFEVGDIESIELLLKNGAKVNIVNDIERTMLHVLLIHSWRKMPSRRGDQLYKNGKAILFYIEQLVKLGIDVNAKDVGGDTAMHFFFVEQDEHAKCFELLLDLGVDINLENDDGVTPYVLIIGKFQRPIGKGPAIFYHHVPKLKALGVKIHPRNEEICELILEVKCIEDEELLARERQRSDEIARMKNLMVGAATSLYDFLKLDARRASLYATCRTLENIAEDEDLRKNYPSYAYLIQLQYRKAVDRLQGQAAVQKRFDFDTDESYPAKRRRVV